MRVTRGARRWGGYGRRPSPRGRRTPGHVWHARARQVTAWRVSRWPCFTAGQPRPSEHSTGGGVIRVLLADDHTIVREGVRLCLEAMGDIEVVAEAEDGQMAVQLANQLRPDVAVVDLTMPRLNGVEAIRQIRHDLPETEVVVLSVHDSEPYVVQALRAGAAGYVLKRNAATELAAAIRAAHDGQAHLHQSIARRLIDDYMSRNHTSA